MPCSASHEFYASLRYAQLDAEADHRHQLHQWRLARDALADKRREFLRASRADEAAALEAAGPMQSQPGEDSGAQVTGRRKRWDTSTKPDPATHVHDTREGAALDVPIRPERRHWHESDPAGGARLVPVLTENSTSDDPRRSEERESAPLDLQATPRRRWADEANPEQPLVSFTALAGYAGDPPPHADTADEIERPQTSDSTVQELLYPEATESPSPVSDEPASSAPEILAAGLSSGASQHPSDSTVGELLYPTPIEELSNTVAASTETPTALQPVVDQTPTLEETLLVPLCESSFDSGMRRLRSEVNSRVAPDYDLVATAKERRLGRDPQKGLVGGQAFKSSGQSTPSGEEFVRQCIVTPLSYQAHAVSTAVIGYLLDDLHLREHFEALRTFVLFASGDFARCLADELARACTTEDPFDSEDRSVRVILSGRVLLSALSASGLDVHPVSSTHS